MNKQDLLQAIFERQRAFQDRLTQTKGRPDFGAIKIPDFGQPDTVSQHLILQLVSENAHALAHEAAELEDWTPWKSWSTQSGNKEICAEDMCVTAHIHEMRLEVADAMCFLVNCAMALGMDAQMFHDIHEQKMGVNHQRQDSGVY